MIYKNSLQMRQYEEVKNKRMEKDIPCTHDQKKAEVATLLPDKADSRKKKHYGEEGHYLTTAGMIRQETQQS